MTWESEIQKERGLSTILLFEFRFEGEEPYCYTDSEEDVHWGGRTYRAESVEMSEVREDGTFDSVSLKITTPAKLVPAGRMISSRSSAEVSFRAFEGQATDPDREFRSFWAGRCAACLISEDGTAVFSAEPAATILARPGLRINWQRGCPYPLYGPLCRAPRVEQQVGVVSVSNGVVRAQAPGNGFRGAESYTGGSMTWQDSGRTVRESIVDSYAIGSDIGLVLSRTPESLPGSVTILRGCAHTESACLEWHDNILNFGGHPFIPLENPVADLTEFL